MMRHVFKPSPPYWRTPESESASALSHPVLHGRKRSEVSIIGAGITGLISGLFLLRAGRTVTLVEGRTVGSGETSRSTAHLTEILDSRLHHLVSRFGAERMMRYTEAHRMAIHRLGSLIEELDVPGGCGWSRLPGYLFCENDSRLDELQKELEALDRLKIACALVRHVPLPFGVAQAIRVENQAQVDPNALLRLLLRAFLAEGGVLFENSRVTEVSPIRNGVRISTSTGSVTSEHCIVATHSPILIPSVSHFQLLPRNTYVLAAQLKSAPLMDGLFWDMSDPYHYLRIADGKLLLGGEDHRTGNPETTPLRAMERLEDYLHSRFEVDSVVSAWSGQVLDSIDGLPLVGHSLRSERIFYSTGLSGNGISQGMLSGTLLSELVQGRREDLAGILTPHRLTRPRDTRAWLSNAFAYPRSLMASFAGRPLAEKLRGEGDLDPSTLAPDEGQVGTINGKRVASHRGLDGALRTVSARCTHLGGEVSFNDFEKTWDCPCHGSRFSSSGEVLSGPACKPLERLWIEEKTPAALESERKLRRKSGASKKRGLEQKRPVTKKAS